MNILLAEDDRAFGTILKRELEDDGYTIDLVHDGVEAVLKAIENNYGFVILDIKMPRLDGIHALKIIKKLYPSIPAITISGNAGNGEMADSVRVGALRCFTKPFVIEQLKCDIRQHISRRTAAVTDHVG